MPQWTLFDEYMRILDAIWPLVAFLIPPVRQPGKQYKRKPGAGRPRTDNRVLINTILYALITGTQWCAIYPNEEIGLCNGKTAHRWLMTWGAQGFFEKLMNFMTKLLNQHSGLKLQWVSIDGSLTKAPLAQEAVGRNPTDRGKNGSKRSLCVDESGVIVAMVHSAANVHDCKLLQPTLDALKEIVPEGVEVHVCLDAGYTGYAELVSSYGFIPHIKSRGKEKKEIETNPKFKAKRWVVEVAHSFMNQFRKLKVRFEKKLLSFESLSELAASMITIRTIFRKDLGVDSYWYNKKAKNNNLPRRQGKIDFSRYSNIGSKLIQDAIHCNIYKISPQNA